MSHKIKKKFRCLDCGQDTGEMGEFYFVNTDIWMKAVGSKEGMLCIGCLETRINRKLTPFDFTGASINSPKFGIKSLRLMNRLGH